MVTIFFNPPDKGVLCFGVFDGVLYSLLMCFCCFCCGDFYFENFIIGVFVIIMLV